MATAAPIPVSEYLRTSYQPDVDYVDDHIEERCLGELDHSDLQQALSQILGKSEYRAYFKVNPEWRVQVSATRYRVPDVALRRAGLPREQIGTTPPLLCIEILSPEDRMSRLMVRVREFLAMGVTEVWIFDPERRSVQVCREDGIQAHVSGVLTVPETPVTVDPAEIFGVLDEG